MPNPLDPVPSPRAITRRDFLYAASATALAVPLAQLPDSVLGSPHRFFTETEAATVRALCDRIIPADEDPGAAWAGAVEFLDRKLVGYHRRYQPLYRVGLEGVSESSRALFRQEFVGLAPAQQDELLRKLEADQAPGSIWRQIPGRDFFNRLVEHTLEGFYGGPRHGGNREAVSWRMLGLPTPPLRSRRPLTAIWNDATAPAPQRR
jgi:gluconate 2-dehydrogenase gamma chain